MAEQSIASAEEYGASLEQAGLQLDGEVGADVGWMTAVAFGLKGQAGKTIVPQQPFEILSVI